MLRSKGSWLHESFCATVYSVFNRPIGSWNVASVTNMVWTFAYAKTFNQNLASWNVQRVSGFYMFPSPALSNCNMKALYTAWGDTFQKAYPDWSLLCPPTPSPSTATPRYPTLLGPS